MAQPRHKRETPARTPKSVLVAAPVAVVATLSAVISGVSASDEATPDSKLLASTPTESLASRASNPRSPLDRRDLTVSRSQLRSSARVSARVRLKNAERAQQDADRAEQRATLRAIRGADVELWTTADLNLWNGPSADAARVGLINARDKVLVTGRREADRAEVVVHGESRWVTAAYLADTKPAKPEPPQTGPELGGQCANGASITAGRAALYDIFNTVCANWPQIVSYGTWRNDGEHGEGRAMDIMVSGDTGWAVADFLRANYAALGIEYLIYARNIWSVDRAGEGWRGMADRGSITANHLDHVHVTVY